MDRRRNEVDIVGAKRSPVSARPNAGGESLSSGRAAWGLKWNWAHGVCGTSAPERRAAAPRGQTLPPISSYLLAYRNRLARPHIDAPPPSCPPRISAKESRGNHPPRLSFSSPPQPSFPFTHADYAARLSISNCREISRSPSFFSTFVLARGPSTIRKGRRERGGGRVALDNGRYPNTVGP